MAIEDIEKIVENFNPDSTQTHERQLQAYAVDFLAENPSGTRKGRKTRTSKTRADGNRVGMTITLSDDQEERTIEFTVYDASKKYKTKTEIDEAGWETYLKSALYRKEVNNKIDEVDKLTAQGEVVKDLMPFEQAVETLTALLGPKHNLQLGDRTIDVSIKQNVFRSVYENCLKDIDAAYERLAEKFAYFEGKLGEGLTLSVRTKVTKYGDAYGTAERRAKLLK